MTFLAARWPGPLVWCNGGLVGPAQQGAPKCAQRARGRHAGGVFGEYFAVVAPRDTPQGAIATLGAAFRQAIRQTAARLNDTAGVTPRAGFDTNAQVMTLVLEGVERSTRILRAADFDPE